MGAIAPRYATGWSTTSYVDCEAGHGKSRLSLVTIAAAVSWLSLADLSAIFFASMVRAYRDQRPQDFSREPRTDNRSVAVCRQIRNAKDRHLSGYERPASATETRRLASTWKKPEWRLWSKTESCIRLTRNATFPTAPFTRLSRSAFRNLRIKSPWWVLLLKWWMLRLQLVALPLAEETGTSLARISQFFCSAGMAELLVIMARGLKFSEWKEWYPVPYSVVLQHVGDGTLLFYWFSNPNFTCRG